MGEQKSALGRFEKRFGDVIRSRRQALKVSQEEFAERCQLHRTYISQIERGLKSVSLKALVRLAKALKTRPSQLLKEAEDLSGG